MRGWKPDRRAVFRALGAAAALDGPAGPLILLCWEDLYFPTALFLFGRSFCYSIAFPGQALPILLLNGAARTCSLDF